MRPGARLPLLLLLALLPITGCEDPAVTQYNSGIRIYYDASKEDGAARLDTMRQAADRFQRAIDADPEFGEAYWNLAIIQREELNEAQAAMENFQQAYRLFDAGSFKATVGERRTELTARSRLWMLFLKDDLGGELTPEERTFLEDNLRLLLDAG